MNSEKKELKILSVGNSFSIDTMQHVAKIANDLGYRVKLGNLYVSGCSLNKHYLHATEDLPAYRYYTTDNETDWTEAPNVRIREAIASEEWDWISIQHGTKDGSRYTDPGSYEKLVPLTEYIHAQERCPAKLAFNMTWVGEPYRKHHEILSYNGDQLLMYRLIADIMRDQIAPLPQLDALCPTGTAVQNARTVYTSDRMSRDGYHLSYDFGRYIAGLTFFAKLSGADISKVQWAPVGVTEEERLHAIAAAKAAIAKPYEITSLL